MAALFLLAPLSACGGSDDDTARTTSDRADATRAAAAEVFPPVGVAVKAQSWTSGGTGRWDQCGLDPIPTGAEYVVEVAVTGADTAGSRQADLIRSALEPAGWTVGTVTSETVEASKDGIAFRAEYGGGVNLSVRSGCIETSADEAKRLGDETPRDLRLPLPSPPPTG